MLSREGSTDTDYWIGNPGIFCFLFVTFNAMFVNIAHIFALLLQTVAFRCYRMS